MPDCGEVDIGGEIAGAGFVEGVEVGAMVPIATKGSNVAVGVVERLFVESIVDKDEEGFSENFGEWL